MNQNKLKFLILGDVVGESGIAHLRKNLWSFRKKHEIDFVIANGENATAIHGISSRDAEKLLDTGVDLITLGNHTWNMRDVYAFLDAHTDSIIRPANYPPTAPGVSYAIKNVCGWRVLVMNVLGVVFMDSLPSPFESVEKILTRENGNFDISILDLHAEATSEKLAVGKYFDGRIDLIFGTHTHVRTDDARVLPRGTAYITDVGMTGPTDGILGTDATAVITKFLTHMPSHFTVAQGDTLANGIIFEYDTNKNCASGIIPIDF